MQGRAASWTATKSMSLFTRSSARWTESARCSPPSTTSTPMMAMFAPNLRSKSSRSSGATVTIVCLTSRAVLKPIDRMQPHGPPAEHGERLLVILIAKAGALAGGGDDRSEGGHGSKDTGNRGQGSGGGNDQGRSCPNYRNAHSDCVAIVLSWSDFRQFTTIASGARGFWGSVFDLTASRGRKSLLSLALRIVELRRNSIGGDIIPPFCALATTSGTGKTRRELHYDRNKMGPRMVEKYQKPGFRSQGCRGHGWSFGQAQDATQNCVPYRRGGCTMSGALLIPSVRRLTAESNVGPLSPGVETNDPSGNVLNWCI